MLKQLCILVVVLCLVSCASDPSEGNGVFKKHQFDEGTQLSTPTIDSESSKDSSYFVMIEKDILSAIETGSPYKIQKAMSELRSIAKSSEQAKVLLLICDTIMDYAWPSVATTDYTLEEMPANVYTIIIDSVKRGIYDEYLEPQDFITLTIPSLVILKDAGISSYFDQAKTTLEKSLALYGDSVLTRYLLGVLHSKNGDYSTALAYFDAALLLDENNIDIHYAYLETLYVSKDYNRLYEVSRELILEKSKDSKVLSYCAQATYNLGLFDETDRLIKDIFQLDSKNTYLYLLQARVLFELGNYFDASTSLDQYLKTNPETIDSILLESKLDYVWKKDISAAIKSIENALELYPDNEDVLLVAAELAVQSGKKVGSKNATELLSSIIEKDPSNTEALEVVLEDYISKEEWEQAYKISSYILDSANISEDSVINHIRVCLELNFIIEARSYIEDYYNEQNSDFDLQQVYLQLLIAEENFTEAESLINTMLPSSSGSVKSMLYFERSKMQSDTKLKLADLRSSLTSNPRNEATLYELYLYYYNRGDYNKAQYYLKQVMVLKPNVTDIQQEYQELQLLLQ